MSLALPGVAGKPLVLVDATVWVDYFSDRRGTAHEIALLFNEVDRRGGMLLTSVITAADVYTLLFSYLRGELADVEQEPSRAACSASAWGCIRLLRERSTIVGADLGDCLEAEYLRQVHDDFRDGLLLAAAKRGRANIILTENEQLRSHSPVIALSVGELCELLGVERGDSDVAVV